MRHSINGAKKPAIYVQDEKHGGDKQLNLHHMARLKRQQWRLQIQIAHDWRHLLWLGRNVDISSLHGIDLLYWFSRVVVRKIHALARK